MKNFIIAFEAIVPFLLYLGFGYTACRGGVFDEAFANKLNKVVFKLFFPCLTFYNVYNASLEGMPSTRLLLAVILSLLLLIAILCLIVPHFVKERKRIGVVVQGIFRSNVLLYGLPLTINLFGEKSAATTAMIVTVCITIYNVMAVIVLEWFGGDSRTGVKDLLIGVCKNPLLQGAVLGGILFAAHIRIPESVEKVVAAFSNMTSPLALFVLGATLHFPAIRRNAKYITGVLCIKMLLLPAIMLGLGLLLHLKGMELFLLVMVYATPVATSSYPMAQNMGGDGELAGQLVMLSTVASLFTLFFWIYLMKTLTLF